VTPPTRVRWSAPARSYDLADRRLRARVVAAVERALSEAGFQWRREVTTDTSARLTEKDAGFSVERFLDAIAAFERLDADGFDLSRAAHEQLRNEVAAWPQQIRSGR
jgi:hypothetical protein